MKKIVLYIALIIIALLSISLFFILNQGSLKDVAFTDDQIIQAYIAKHKSNDTYPPGFFYDNKNAYYINSWSIRDSHNRSNIARYDLCTDDYDEALNFAEKTNTYSSQTREISFSEKTERYVEFLAYSDQYQPHSFFYRVHLCSYFEPNDDNQKLEDGSIVLGTFNKKPLNQKSFQSLIQYFITTKVINTPGVVLDAYSQGIGDYIYYTVYMVYGLEYDTEFRPDAAYNMADITLSKHVYKIDTKTRIVTSKFDTIKTIEEYKY